MNCRPPEAALTVLGRWKQRNSGEATHLQLSAGSYKVPTAIAGSTGAFSVGLLFCASRLIKFLVLSFWLYEFCAVIKLLFEAWLRCFFYLHIRLVSTSFYKILYITTDFDIFRKY